MVTAAEMWSRYAESVGDWIQEHEAFLSALCLVLILASLAVCLDW